MGLQFGKCLNNQDVYMQQHIGTAPSNGRPYHCLYHPSWCHGLLYATHNKMCKIADTQKNNKHVNKTYVRHGYVLTTSPDRTLTRSHADSIS